MYFFFSHENRFFQKIDFRKPGEAVRTRGNPTSQKKWNIFRPKNVHFFSTLNLHLGFCCRNLSNDFEWIFDIFQHKPYLRYWYFALRPIFRWKTGCDRFPSKFSKKWFSLEGKCTFCRQVQFPSRRTIFLKTGLGAYRSPFPIEKSNAWRKISIEDWIYVEGSQRSFKVDKKIS